MINSVPSSFTKPAWIYIINNGFPNYIVDEQIKRMIKNVYQQNKHCTAPPSQQTYIKPFFMVTKCTTIKHQMKRY